MVAHQRKEQRMSIPRTYSLEIAYLGHDPDRAPYYHTYYEAEDPEAALQYAMLLSHHWTESDIAVYESVMPCVQHGYKMGDAIQNGGGTHTEIARWSHHD